MKRLAIFIDGTWNEPTQHDKGHPAPTNVFQLRSATPEIKEGSGPFQLVHYSEGVGATGNKLKDLYEGYSGSGTSDRIKEAYAWLIKNYAPGDQIYLFGFSRGAFAVRSLGGMIRKCGILRTNSAASIDDAYRFYRNTNAKSHPDKEIATRFRGAHAVEQTTRIHFIGVFDTVGALGNPLLPGLFISRFSQFHDTTLSSTVSNAYQAVAICERRKLFLHTPWEQSLNEDGTPKNPQQVLEQRWFIGAHADIGGGYHDNGLARKTLLWMAEKAHQAGLTISPLPANGSGVCVCHDETVKNRLYQLMDPVDRPIDNTPTKITNEVLDESVLTLMRKQEKLEWLAKGYQPKGLFDYLARRGITI
ncbi:MAG: DUF2235 domain-containing protein [Moraxellaceae bacterium]|nr:DUF2235 domain-containing protein [Moraxellaceae bacterium]